MKKMIPLFGSLLLIFIFSFSGIETSNEKLKEIKTNTTDTASDRDDEPRRDEYRTILNIVTPAHQKITQAGRWNEFDFGKSYDKTGEKAYKMFLEHYQERGLPNAPKVTLDLYNERHASGCYHIPEEQGATTNYRYDKARAFVSGNLVSEHHQKMYKDHHNSLVKQRTDQQTQDFSDYHQGSVSNSREIVKEENDPNIFIEHHQGRGLPNIPATTNELNTQSHHGGSDEQHMYQQNQTFQDHFGGLGPGSSYDQLYTAPRNSQSKYMNPLNNPRSEDINLEANQSSNNPFDTGLTDNNKIKVKREYDDRSRGSGSSSKM